MVFKFLVSTGCLHIHIVSKSKTRACTEYKLEVCFVESLQYCLVVFHFMFKFSVEFCMQLEVVLLFKLVLKQNYINAINHML